ncbi:MAG TPA: acylneuraminate cytidylyltransferase [Anaerolineales bacterium]|nr:acylneuraminate cytidylyltransferase [Anaerolineales bacterium]
MHILALIPARGGSKSIPRKNIRPLAGYPLIAYSIAAALHSQNITRTIVSTDDAEIARVAQSYGAEAPFLRPPEFAMDNTTDFPVFAHALSWLKENEDYQPDIVVQLRPTSPLRPPDCVDRAIQIMADHPEADSVRGVIPSGQNPYKMWRVDEHGRMTPLLSVERVAEPYNAPRQELPQTYWQTGHIDAIRLSTILQKHSLSGEVILPLFLDPRYAIDIDSLRDWQRAEWIISQGDLPIVQPGQPKRPLPRQVDLVVFDFDGVMTDDRVWVDQAGDESVAANRSDGMGIAALRQSGIPMVVLSTEPNPVVTARCRKLEIPAIQGLADKASALQHLLQERQLDPTHVVYLGNDRNDLPCFPLVGCAVVVADAHPDVLPHADIILTRRGGHGAVRELCDRILRNKE